MKATWHFPVKAIVITATAVMTGGASAGVPMMSGECVLRAGLLMLDDQELVHTYVDAIIEKSTDKALARKIAYKDQDLLDPIKAKTYAGKLRMALRSGALGCEDFQLFSSRAKDAQ